MTPEAIRQLQISLRITPTGVLDDATMKAMSGAVSNAISANPEIAKYAGVNNIDTILDAYMTGDWSNVISLTGVPFSQQQQEAAVAEAEKVLGPAYREIESYDRATTTDALRRNQEGFDQFRKDEESAFGAEKDELDQEAADRGILFSGARVQKLRDLRNTYEDREALMRKQTAEQARDTTRAFQYDYGNRAAENISDMYRLPESSKFNANVAGGEVTPNRTMSSVYNPSEFNFQGRQPVAQKAAVQTRAARTLTNRANKLSLTGYMGKL